MQSRRDFLQKGAAGAAVVAAVPILDGAILSPALAASCPNQYIRQQWTISGDSAIPKTPVANPICAPQYWNLGINGSGATASVSSNGKIITITAPSGYRYFRVGALKSDGSCFQIGTDIITAVEYNEHRCLLKYTIETEKQGTVFTDLAVLWRCCEPRPEG